MDVLGEPSFNNDRCITQDQEGTWHARDCRKRKPFICRIPTLPEALSSTSPTLASPFSIDLPKRNSCEDGWTYSDVTGKCYKTFTQAVRTCLELDSKLISIHSALENEWLTAYARPAVDKFFVGLVFNGIDDKWAWMDGSETDFLPWYVARGEPNNAGGCEFCGEVKANYRPSNGLWNDVTCDAVRAVICEKEDA
ncbi:Protein CLEC-51 [Aphelenchoides avenae]|nr:Protein CLEC-51 [Aphelenchus avenae]